MGAWTPKGPLTPRQLLNDGVSQSGSVVEEMEEAQRRRDRAAGKDPTKAREDRKKFRHRVDELVQAALKSKSRIEEYFSSEGSSGSEGSGSEGSGSESEESDPDPESLSKF